MSETNHTSEERVATNGEWSGAEAVGMVWDGSMFLSAPRDSRFHGPQDPLDFVPSPGPPDDEDGDEAWRKAAQGTVIYTGDEFVETSRPPTAGDHARRQAFMDEYVAQQPLSAAAAAQGQRQVPGEPLPAASEEQSFPDALPTPSETVPALLAQHQVLEPVHELPSLPVPQAPAPYSAAALAPASAPAPTSSLPIVPGPSPLYSSDVDGEYELDDDYLPDALQASPTSTNTVDQEQVPRTSSPRAVDGWDDANLLTLWKHKVIRKKGYEPMQTLFKNQTVESLHEAWTTHKERCKQLGAAWEAAGRPTALLSEWFEG